MKMFYQFYEPMQNFFTICIIENNNSEVLIAANLARTFKMIFIA